MITFDYQLDWLKEQLRLCMWCTPVIPALRRQRQVDFCEFEARVIYIVSSTLAKAIE